MNAATDTPKSEKTKPEKAPSEPEVTFPVSRIRVEGAKMVNHDLSDVAAAVVGLKDDKELTVDQLNSRVEKYLKQEVSA